MSLQPRCVRFVKEIRYQSWTAEKFQKKTSRFAEIGRAVQKPNLTDPNGRKWKTPKTATLSHCHRNVLPTFQWDIVFMAQPEVVKLSTSNRCASTMGLAWGAEQQLA